MTRMYTRRSALAAGAGLAAGAFLPRFIKRRKPDILFILCDALRADHFTPELMPALSSIARRGLQCTNCYSASTQTKVSMASIFCGGPPSYHGLLPLDTTLGQGTWTLAQMMQDTGYQTAAFITNPWLWPETDQTAGFSQGFRRYEIISPESPSNDQEVFYSVAEDVCVWLHGVLAGRDIAKPIFAYVHLMETHQPWIRRGSHHLDLVHRAFSNGDDLTPEEHAIMRRIYADTVRRVDTGLRLVLAEWKRAGLRIQDTVLIVTADHGDELHEYHKYGHCGMPTEELIRVPFVMAGPGIPQHRQSEALCQNTAIMDTLRAMLGLGGPHDPMFPSLLTNQSYPVLAEYMPVDAPVRVDRALLTPAGDKALWTDTAKGAQGVQVSNWRGEDAASNASALLAEAERLKRRWTASGQRDHVRSAETSLAWQEYRATRLLTEEEAALRKQLRALGYLQ